MLVHRNAYIALPVSSTISFRIEIMLILSLLSFCLTTACAVSEDYSHKKSLITVQKGNIPIVLSAPHGGRYLISGVPERNGKQITRNFITQRDANTSELAEDLSLALEKRFGAKPYLIIARFDRKYLDANRRPDEAYE